jgi:anti-sigma B factor antagonist
LKKEDGMEELYKIEKQDGIAIMNLIIANILTDDNDSLKNGFSSLLDEGYKNIILDLSKTEYISSLVLASFVFMLKKVKESGGNIIFCCINKKIKEILTITNLDKIFDIANDRQEAIKRLSKK